MTKSILLLNFCLLINIAFAQNERSIARNGNKNYNNGLFSESEVDYRKSISRDKSFEEAQFNLSDALFKQERYDESINTLNSLISKTKDSSIKADSYYNLGNNFLQQQKIEEAVEAYKNCLRINPSDEEARYNLSKAISILDNQQQEKNNQDSESDQENNDQQESQDSGETDSPEDEEDKKDNDSQNQNNNSESSDNTEEQTENNSEQLSGEDLSKQEMERILDALEREEQKVQEDVKKMKAKSSSKKVEKDW